MTSHLGGGTIISSPLFTNLILPFLLIFVVVFAILQKTRILGEGKKQIDAIVALVIGLIVVSFSFATGIIVALIPFLAVSVVIILVFFILYGMLYQEGKFEIGKGLRIGLGVVIGIAVIIAVLIATGAWDYLAYTYFTGSGVEGSAIVGNIIFLIIVIVAIIIVVVPGRKRIAHSEST